VTESGKYNIQFGSVTGSQIVVGDYNTVSQRIGLSPEETAQLRALFSDLRTTVGDVAPKELRGEAIAQANELEGTLVSEHPDPGSVRRVLGWFRQHAPELAGAVLSVLVNPLVGKVIEGAGSAIAEKLHQVVAEAIDGPQVAEGH